MHDRRIKQLRHAHAVDDERNIVAQKQGGDESRLALEKQTDKFGRKRVFGQLHLKLQTINAIEGNLQARAERREKQGNRNDNPTIHRSFLLIHIQQRAA